MYDKQILMKHWKINDNMKSFFIFMCVARSTWATDDVAIKWAERFHAATNRRDAWSKSDI